MKGETRTYLASALRTRREHLGLTLDGLAHKAHVQVERLLALESALVQDPDQRELRRLAEALLTAPTALTGEPEPAAAPALARLRLAVSEGEALVVTGDWPVRLWRACFAERLLAEASDDAFAIEVWRRAEAIALAYPQRVRMERRAA